MSYSYSAELAEWEKERSKSKEVRDAEIERKKLAVQQMRAMIADEVRWQRKGIFGKKWKLKWDAGEVKLVERRPRGRKIKFDKVEPWRKGYMKNVVFHVALSEYGRSMATLFPALRYDFHAVMLVMYNMVFNISLCLAVIRGFRPWPPVNSIHSAARNKYLWRNVILTDNPSGIQYHICISTFI